MELRNQALLAVPIAAGCCIWNAWALGWKLGAVSIVFWMVWFAIVIGFLVRHVSIPEFKERNEEGLPYITGNKVVLGVLPWGTRLSMASLVATGITIVLTLVLNGQANQQRSGDVKTEGNVKTEGIKSSPAPLESSKSTAE